MMKFTKTLLGVALAAALSFSLAACNNGGGGGNSGTGTESSGGGAASGETIDSGDFTAVCPDGFLNVEQSDMFEEADEDGNYPLKTDILFFSYGAKDVFDSFSKPSVTINLENEGMSMEDSISMFGWFYENIEEKTFNIGGTDYQGIEADFDMSLDDDDPEIYHYQIVYLEDGGRLFNVTIITSMSDEDTGLNVDNADVQTIIKSIKLK